VVIDELAVIHSELNLGFDGIVADILVLITNWFSVLRGKLCAVVPVVVILVFALPALIVLAPVEKLEATMMEKITPPQDQAMVQKWMLLLRKGNFGEIEQGLDASLRTGDLREKLDAMARSIPAEEPRSVKPIGYLVVHHPDSSRTIKTTLEYEFKDRWLLATMIEQEQSGTATVTGFHVYPIPESVERHNRFTLVGKEPVNYVVLLLSLAALAVSAYGVIASLRTSMGKKKWLWAAVCLVGVGRLAVNWTTGAVGFTPLWIGFPPCGATMVPLYSPWVVFSSLPVGAVVFLTLGDRLARTRSAPGSPRAEGLLPSLPDVVTEHRA
jgi:hypothetical protein